ncbi:cellulose biosynthesis cyclic di-GMP-binding regulatory protein BcsB [Novosphingobium beihaiensis]|uniref:Cyclic di-GMP-binding protein n=1 Tax=Novosphingobium beihaiensis TaxID=2930389 RepID=A0ABT0BUW7_9SPHN|nr:cellulose biosynthesis cyclic di-GMP-binding regulatory protein BcsB [Novosphingobium beihaiensis]MCJ2188863.1 cellulose biosynthesis cyclic di-GMP-binding regulatory protein BcsB [Novosphingobium beihaiensis]
MTSRWRLMPLSAAAGTILTAAAPATNAPAQTATVPAAAPQVVTRRISLTELGFTDGIEMPGLSGSRDIFFPLPRAEDVEGLRLQLPYRSGSAFESRRSLDIEINGQPQLSIALSGDRQNGVIDIPVAPGMIRNGYLALRLRYGGAITEDRCVDQRISGAYLSFAPEGTLIAGLKPGALATVAKVAAIMPRTGAIHLPDQASENQAAAALTLAAGTGFTITPPPASAQPIGNWTQGWIGLGGAKAPSLAVAANGTVPGIRIGGTDPAAAARLFASRWKALAATPDIGKGLRQAANTPASMLTLTGLGADLPIQTFSDRATWTVSLPATALPAGRRYAGLAIDLAVADDGSDTPAIVSATMDGLLLGSTRGVRDGTTHLDVNLPEGLATARNTVEIAVTRQVRAGDCAYAPQGYPAQVLPSSRALLADAPEPADFHDLAPAFAGGVTVVVPGPQQIPALQPLLSTLLGKATPISVSYGKIPEKGPFVFLSKMPPPGATPLVRFDQGRVRIAAEGGRTLISSDAIGSLTVAQLVETGGRPALWVRPGSGFAALADAGSAAGLARGNVAFLDTRGIDLAFSTLRDELVEIRYPDQTNLAQWLHRYRLWLIGLGWLLVSAGFIYLLRRIYSARSSAG